MTSRSERIAAIILLVFIGLTNWMIIELVHAVAVHVWKINSTSNPYQLSIWGRNVVSVAVRQAGLFKVITSVLTAVLIALQLFEWRFVSRLAAVLAGLALFVLVIGWAVCTFYFMVGGYLVL